MRKGEVARVAGSPKVDFKPKRLMTAEDRPGTFLIERITIGGEDYLRAPLSASMFAPSAISPIFGLGITSREVGVFKAGVEVAFFVRKITKGRKATFAAVFLGTIEEELPQKRPKTKRSPGAVKKLPTKKRPAKRRSTPKRLTKKRAPKKQVKKRRSS
jgi:hypothetical protein